MRSPHTQLELGLVEPINRQISSNQQSSILNSSPSSHHLPAPRHDQPRRDSGNKEVVPWGESIPRKGTSELNVNPPGPRPNQSRNLKLEIMESHVSMPSAFRPKAQGRSYPSHPGWGKKGFQTPSGSHQTSDSTTTVSTNTGFSGLTPKMPPQRRQKDAKKTPKTEPKNEWPSSMP